MVGRGFLGPRECCIVAVAALGGGSCFQRWRRRGRSPPDGAAVTPWPARPSEETGDQHPGPTTRHPAARPAGDGVAGVRPAGRTRAGVQSRVLLASQSVAGRDRVGKRFDPIVGPALAHARQRRRGPRELLRASASRRVGQHRELVAAASQRARRRGHRCAHRGPRSSTRRSADRVRRRGPLGVPSRQQPLRAGGAEYRSRCVHHGCGDRRPDRGDAPKPGSLVGRLRAPDGTRWVRLLVFSTGSGLGTS